MNNSQTRDIGSQMQRKGSIPNMLDFSSLYRCLTMQNSKKSKQIKPKLILQHKVNS